MKILKKIVNYLYSLVLIPARINRLTKASDRMSKEMSREISNLKSEVTSEIIRQTKKNSRAINRIESSLSLLTVIIRSKLIEIDSIQKENAQLLKELSNNNQLENQTQSELN